MDDEKIIALEERIAHLSTMLDEMSDEMARQGREMDQLTRRVALLMQREAEREVDASGAFPLADQKPPHW